jgi:hypothetical protein
VVEPRLRNRLLLLLAAVVGDVADRRGVDAPVGEARRGWRMVQPWRRDPPCRRTVAEERASLARLGV